MLFSGRFGKLTHTKSTLHLLYSEPIPWELLREMLEFCVQERLKKKNKTGFTESGKASFLIIRIPVIISFSYSLTTLVALLSQKVLSCSTKRIVGWKVKSSSSICILEITSM